MTNELPDALSFQRPKGEQLGEYLEEFGASLRPGTMLPSERALAERYGVARMTVRQELERLESKGLIYRVQGKGTFVAEPKFTQTQELTSFSEDMRARGMVPGSEVLSTEVSEAHEIVARELGLEVGDPVVRIERIRTADGEPMAYERANLPAVRFPGLENESLADTSLYEILQTKWGVRFARALQRVSVVTLSDEEAARLHVTVGRSAFLFERTTHAADDSAVEYVRSLYRGDRYQVATQLTRSQ